MGDGRGPRNNVAACPCEGKIPIVRDAEGFGGGSASWRRRNGVARCVWGSGWRLEKMQQCGWVPLREGGSASLRRRNGVARCGGKRETRAARNGSLQRHFTARRPCFPSPSSPSAHHSANAVRISDPQGQDETGCRRLYFNNDKMVSGVVVISVTAHRPAPISFRLAPRKWTLSSMIRKRS